jgi:glycosyltransferase 2 family protein
MLVGGNLASELLFASALGTFVLALGHPVGVGELLLVNISVALLAGLVPVPGGIGVSEGGLTYGLINVGVPEESAFAAVMLYRLATFYLPPIWGYMSFRWLQRNGHL